MGIALLLLLSGLGLVMLAAAWGITMTAWMRYAIRRVLDEQGFRPAGGWAQ